jgi:hypothetical protein
MKRSMHLVSCVLAVAILVFLNTYLTAHQFFAHGHVFETHTQCSHDAHHHDHLPADDGEQCAICDVDFAAFAPTASCEVVFRPNGPMGELLAYYIEPQNELFCTWPDLRGPPMNV